MKQISSLIQKTLTTKDRAANVLSFFYNGVFDRYLAQTGHNFYGLLETSVHKWVDTSETPNIHFLDNDFIRHYNRQCFDFILCNDRFKSYNNALSLSAVYHIPILVVDHYTPEGIVNAGAHTQLSTIDGADCYCIHEKIRGGWNIHNPPINYGVEIPPKEDLLNIEYKTDALIVGDYSPSEYPILDAFLKIPDVNLKIIGNNYPLSFPAKDEQELLDEIKHTKVYIHLAGNTGLSYNLLKAMSYGKAVIGSNTPIISSVISGCGIVGSSVEGIVGGLIELLSNDSKRTSIGNAARARIVNEYSLKIFLNKWKKLLTQYMDEVYVR